MCLQHTGTCPRPCLYSWNGTVLSGADVLSPWASLQEAEERIAEAKAVGRKALEENARLQDHIHDLETRKRAPLYQKKQEEELRAAIEKAQEAEGRAVEAEARAKEAKVIVFIMGFPADTPPVDNDCNVGCCVQPTG